MRIASLFSSCGGLDLGFSKAGFQIAYANDNDKAVWETYEKNHGIAIDRRSIAEVEPSEIPDVDGIIGGPPCQSWSVAGEMRGAKDARGMLLHEYIRILKAKTPDFFLIENVPGLVSKRHLPRFNRILRRLVGLGYNVSFDLIDARDYGVPQERRRLMIVGYKAHLGIEFSFPPPTHSEHGENAPGGRPTERWLTLSDCISDLPESVPVGPGEARADLAVPNHEHMNGGFSYIYMSRNRRRGWHEPSFTIPAMARHVPLHPSSAAMVKVGKDKWQFVGDAPQCRRLSVRECARIQAFPDDFIFYYRRVWDGYEMVGNAVPVRLAEVIARKIMADLAGR